MTKHNLPNAVLSHFDRDEFIIPFDKILDKFFTQSFPQLSKEVGIDVFQGSAYPKCDIIDFEDKIEIIAETPGISKDQIHIDIDDDIISIRGGKIGSIEREGGTYLRRELKKSTFKRTFKADPKVFDLDKIHAKFLDGILELTIPKIKTVKATKKTIDIG